MKTLFKRKMSEEHNKETHHKWAKGEMLKGKRIFHPYTRKDFKFNLEKS